MWISHWLSSVEWRVNVFLAAALLAVAVAILLQGRPERVVPFARDIPVRILASGEEFVPSLIRAEVGDRLVFVLENESDESHRFVLDAFGISVGVLPRATARSSEARVDRAGSFVYYCAVDAAEGVEPHFGEFGVITVDG
jgi:plastocyanin